MIRRSSRQENLNTDENEQPAAKQQTRSTRYFTRSSVNKRTTTTTTTGRAALGNITNNAARLGGLRNMRGKNNVNKYPAKTGQTSISSRNVIINARTEKKLTRPRRSPMDTAMDTGEDDVESPFAAIDAADVNNVQQMVPYINDMYTVYMNTETKLKPSNTYMAKQRDITAKMRGILVDWLIEVHLKFQLQPETLFLTINLLDRFLERRAVSRTKLQLVGCAAMLLACKYEEIYVPEILDFVHISDKAYTREQMLAMETIMLNTLGFRLTMPSALKFATRQQKVAGQAGNEKQAHLCHFLMELTLQDYDFLQFKPSQLAATATFLSLRMLGLSDWTTLLAQYTGYNLGDLMPCAKAMYVLLHKDPVKYRAVRKKYGHRKFNAVALVPASSAYHPMFA